MKVGVCGGSTLTSICDAAIAPTPAGHLVEVSADEFVLACSCLLTQAGPVM